MCNWTFCSLLLFHFRIRAQRHLFRGLLVIEYYFRLNFRLLPKWGFAELWLEKLHHYMLSAISFGSLAGLIWLFAANQGMKNNLNAEKLRILVYLFHWKERKTIQRKLRAKNIVDMTFNTQVRRIHGLRLTVYECKSYILDGSRVVTKNVWIVSQWNIRKEVESSV